MTSLAIPLSHSGSGGAGERSVGLPTDSFQITTPSWLIFARADISGPSDMNGGVIVEILEGTEWVEIDSPSVTQEQSSTGKFPSLLSEGGGTVIGVLEINNNPLGVYRLTPFIQPGNQPASGSVVLIVYVLDYLD